MFQVRFVLESEVPSDMKVFIVGNHPALGGWNPQNGLPLEQSQDQQWESVEPISVGYGEQIQFKIVQVSSLQQIVWEQLPNNSNRKFKPKHHSKLLLKWNNEMGRLVNEGKASYCVKGLPGVIIRSVEDTGLLRKKKFNPLAEAEKQESDSSQNDEDDPFSSVITRKKSLKARISFSKNDIEEIYYDTCEVETSYAQMKKTKIYFVCYSFDENREFCEKILQQIKQVDESDEISFKWLLLNESKNMNAKLSKVSYAKIPDPEKDKLNIKKYEGHNIHFVFLDLKSAFMTDLGNTSACLYLPSQEYKAVIDKIEEMESFRFICFDSVEKNKELYEFFKEKGYAEADQDFSSNFFENKIDHVSLTKIIEELYSSKMISTPVHTAYTFTRKQALNSILTERSVLIVDSAFLEKDEQFTKEIMSRNCPKRFIIIVCSEEGTPEWIHNFENTNNVFIILKEFKVFYFAGKMYEPLKKHNETIQLYKLKAKMLVEQFGGQFELNDKSLTIKLKDPKPEFLKKIYSEAKVLMKDLNYFKIAAKENKIKISWTLSHQIRLLRTICRIKYMEEGQIGNFYIVSSKDNFSPLKQKIKLLISVMHPLLLRGKQAKVYYFGYGKVDAKFKISTKQ